MRRSGTRLLGMVAITSMALGFLLVPVAVPGANAKKDGTQLLFNGKDLTGWMNSRGGKPGEAWVVENGTLCLKRNVGGKKRSGGDLWTKERYGDFVLDVEFMTKGNSGIFIRTDNPRNNVQTGIEIQVNRPSKKPGKHSVGAVYDLVAPSENAAKEGWNHVTITAKDNKLMVVLNGTQIIDMDLNRWTTGRKNPDGSKNKFRTALKDFKRQGHIGLQDHGAEVCYRNIKIKPLKDK